MYLKIIVALCALFLVNQKINCQINEGGIPYTWQHDEYLSNASKIVLPGISAIEPSKTKTLTEKNSPLIFAENFYLNANLNNSGQWFELQNGDRLWLLSLKSEGAYSLNVIFNHFIIPQGATLYIFNTKRTQVIGAFTYKNISEWHGLATMPVEGDEIVIEYYEPEEVDFRGEISIETIGHDYLGVFGDKDGQFGLSGDCNVDINCEAGDNWQIQKRAVCRMVSNGSQLCSGALVNNTFEDQSPYLLTANHCVSDQSTAQKTVFVFNYESPTCNGTDGSTNQSISGAELVATKNKDSQVIGYLDFSLLRLKESVPLSYKPYFAGWDSRTNIPTSATCIHHPWGDVKKISIENDALVKASYIGYGYDAQSFLKIQEWDLGTTEGGSSGSPLFDSNKRIVGTLTGGDADCTNPVNDYYQMFSIAYDAYNSDSMQLKHWLEPSNSGVEFIDGYDPLFTQKEITDLATIVHWKEGQTLAFYKANAGGYLAGNNVYQDKAKAEFYNKTEFSPLNVVTGAYVAFGFASGNDNELVEMQILKDEFGIPASILGSAYVTLGEVKEKADKEYVYFAFEPSVEVNTSIYLSIVLPENEGDTVALMTVEEAETNTGWELNINNFWYPYSDPDNSWNISLSHLIAMEIGRYASNFQKTESQTQLTIFPNPATHNLLVKNEEFSEGFITIYDNLGRIQLSKNIEKNLGDISLNIEKLQPGIYHLNFLKNKQLYSASFLKK